MIQYDMHCHLDLFSNMKQMINQIADCDLGILAVGTTPKSYYQEVEFFKNQPLIHVAVGLHPQLVSDRFSEIQILEKLIHETQFVGEIGLDYSRSYLESKENQLLVFSRGIQLCSRIGNKVVSIHAVKSVQDVLNICEQENVTKKNKCIFHWFTGTTAQLRKAARMGFYFSVNPKMLHTKSGQEIISIIPENQILVETDAPFTKHFEEPQLLKNELDMTIKYISEIKGRDLEKKISENAINVISNIGW